MSDKPILFNSGMVWAILEGRKTVTRRVVKGRVPLERPSAVRMGCITLGLGDRV